MIRYQPLTGVMNMERKLGNLFDYQRFENNPHLEEQINDTIRRYDRAEEGALSDDDVEFLNAAGMAVKNEKLGGEKHL